MISENELMSVEAVFYERMIELMLMSTDYQEMKSLDRLKLINIVKKRMKLDNRYEC